MTRIDVDAIPYDPLPGWEFVPDLDGCPTQPFGAVAARTGPPAYSGWSRWSRSDRGHDGPPQVLWEVADPAHWLSRLDTDGTWAAWLVREDVYDLYWERAGPASEEGGERNQPSRGGR